MNPVPMWFLGQLLNTQLWLMGTLDYTEESCLQPPLTHAFSSAVKPVKVRLQIFISWHPECFPPFPTPCFCLPSSPKSSYGRPGTQAEPEQKRLNDWGRVRVTLGNGKSAEPGTANHILHIHSAFSSRRAHNILSRPIGASLK